MPVLRVSAYLQGVRIGTDSREHNEADHNTICILSHQQNVFKQLNKIYCIKCYGTIQLQNTIQPQV